MPRRRENNEENIAPSSVPSTVTRRRGDRKRNKASARLDDHGYGLGTSSKSAGSDTVPQDAVGSKNRASTLDGAPTMIEEALQEFELASHTCGSVCPDSFAKFWQNQPPQLASILITASLQLTETGSDNASLLLDGLAHSLLGNCTKLVQAALALRKSSTPSSDYADTFEKMYQLLFVGVHGLRATCKRSLKPDNCLKTLYHVIILASEQAAHATKHINSTEKLASARMDLDLKFTKLAWAAFEATKVVLLKSHLCTQDENETSTTVIFAINPASEIPSHLQFPTPVKKARSASKSSPLRLEIALEKVMTVVVQATLSMIKMLCSLSPFPQGEHSCLESFQTLRTNKLKLAKPQVITKWIMNLASEIIPQWILCTSQQQRHNTKAREFLAYVNKSHRLLWDFSCTKQKLNLGESLHVQQEAILVLLFHGRDNIPGDLEFELQSTQWETACTVAVKACLAIKQQQRQQGTSAVPQKAIEKFHDKVGAALGRFASKMSTSYFEYCCCRTSQTNSKTQLSVGQNLKAGPDSDLCSHLELLSQVFDLSLLVKRRLLTARPEIAGNVVDMAKDISEHFESRDLETIRASTDFPRILKVFGMASLHRTIFNVLAEARKDKERDLDHASLYAAASLVSKCHAPLYHQSILDSHSSDDASAKDMNWQIFVENSMRGVAAFDFLYQVSSSVCSRSVLRRKADKQMIALADSLLATTQRAPDHCIDKAAKLFAILGKQRMEAGDDRYAATPLLIAVRLFSGQSLNSDCQLTARWSHLGSLMRSIDKGRLEVVCILAAIRERAKEMTTTKSDRPNSFDDWHILPYLTSKCYGNIPRFGTEPPLNARDKTEQSLISRLILNAHLVGDESPYPADKRTKDKAELDANSLVAGIFEDLSNRRTFDSYLQSTSGLEFTLSNLCWLFWRPSVAPCALHHFKSVVNLMQRLGKTLHSHREDPQNQATTKQRHWNLVTSLANIAESLFEETAQCKDVVVALLYMVSSTSILSSDVLVEPDTWCWSECFGLQNEQLDSAVDSASRAREVLEQSSGTSAQLLRHIVQFYMCHLESRGNLKTFKEHDSDLTALCRTILREGCDLPPNATAWAQQCAVGFLLQKSDFLLYRGRTLDSLQLASLNLQMASQWFGEENAIMWLHSRALSLTNSSVAVPGFHSDVDDKLEADAEPLEAEVMACKIRHSILLSGESQEAKHYEGDLRSILHCLPKDVDDPLVSWTKSTVILGLADIAVCTGDFCYAIDATREALSLCSSLMANSFEVHAPIKISIFVIQNRILECIASLARLYGDGGDRKRAEVYAIECMRHVDLQDAMTSSASTEKEQEVMRLVQFLQKRKQSVEQIECEIQHSAQSSINADAELCSVDSDLQNVLDAFHQARCFAGSIQQSNSWLKLHSNAKQALVRFFDSERIKHLAEALPAKISPSCFCEMKLNEARAAFSAYGRCDNDEWERIRLTCMDISRQVGAPRSCRAEAYYLLGLLELDVARKSGSLHQLWAGSSNIPISEENTETERGCEDARSFFYSALALSGPSSTVLTRNILRSLALVVGPEPEGGEKHISANTLVHISIGASYRTATARSLIPSAVHEIFHLLDSAIARNEERFGGEAESFFQQLEEYTPQNWRFVGSCLCPTGEMIVSSWERSNVTGAALVRTTCIFPLDGDQRLYDAFLSPLDQILSVSKAHTEETKEHAPESRGEVLDWWKTRRAIDKDLESLLKNIEEQYFSNSTVRNSLFCDDPSTINLSSKFADVASEAIDPPNMNDLKDLKVIVLKERLSDFGITAKDVRNFRKADLVSLLASKLSQSCERTTREMPTTILVLDEHLQRFPFESLPSFEDKSVCRIPSIAFALAKLKEIEADATLLSVNPDRTSYVLDPEGNLPATRKRIEKSLRSMQTFQECMWEGVVGQIPSRDFMFHGLTQEQGLFLYFGHGDTKKFFRSSDLQQLLEPDENGVVRRLHSSVFLMGCSSGKLESVLREGSHDLREQFLHYLPEGTAISYLSAGAPCVVGNLWDVTDIEIDKFAVKCLHLFLEGDGGQKTMPECLSVARSACKLRYATGASPVCYGLPVHLL